jgi:hypothetical protein
LGGWLGISPNMNLGFAKSWIALFTKPKENVIKSKAGNLQVVLESHWTSNQMGMG